ncbi:MAG: hypothetical protein MI723_18970 [Caulobacterales bacterium]|nr:hypothetical protein [Caulobacterales bacterium]
MAERRAHAGLAGLALALALGGAARAEGPFDGPLPIGACAGWKGERVCEVLHEDEQIIVSRCIFPPGGGHDPHYHPPRVGYVLEGGAVMRLATPDGEVEVTPRTDAVSVSDAATVHSVLNVSEDQTLRYLTIEKKYADTRAPEDVAPGLCAEE